VQVDRRRSLGALGERLTALYLESQGYRIRDRNVRLRQGEIDIVAEHDLCLVIVEVRLRKGAGVGVALESISPAKQRRLRRLAAELCAGLDPVPEAVRIDVVGVSLDQQGRLRDIQLVQNAVEGE
jgi:putative endonuclease